MSDKYRKIAPLGRLSLIVAGVAGTAMLATVLISAMEMSRRGASSSIRSLPVGAAPTSAAAASIAPESQSAKTMVQWDPASNADPKSYAIDGYQVVLRTAIEASDKRAELRITSPSGEIGMVQGEPTGSPSASFGIGRVDASAQGEQIVFSTFTGGAHCCDLIKVLELRNGAWTTVDVGKWDGDTLGDFPADVDGDGIADFVLRDDRFLYAFSSYADSRSPPVVIDVIDGKAVDVSASPRFRTVFQKHFDQMQKDCSAHSNSACAVMLADAVRIGLFDQAWQFMLANYDQSSTWDLPTRCLVTRVGGNCPQGQELHPSGFPQAIQWFLEDNGYREADVRN
jgi:hypothetical protein